MLALLCSIALRSLAQIEIDTSITMTGTTASERQVENISFPYDSSNISSINVVQLNSLNYLSTNGMDSLIAFTVFDMYGYEIGARYELTLDSTNTGRLFININNYGYKEVFKFGNESLDSNDIIAGTIVSLIYDGIGFQLLNTLNKGCPTGFTEVHKHLCIETSENTALNFWDAVVHCKNKGAKLCSWGEWYYACQKSGLGLSGMTNNNEWLNQPINNPGQILIQGSGGCKNGSIGVANTQLLTFRCCLRK